MFLLSFLFLCRWQFRDLINRRLSRGCIHRPCIVHHAGLLIEIQVETTDIVIALWKSATEQLPTTYNLHASAAGSHEGQQRLRHHGGTLTDGYGLVVGCHILCLSREKQVGVLSLEVERLDIVMPAQFFKQVGVKLSDPSSVRVKTGQYGDSQN